ncbi:hypothetical protein ACRAWD_15965 [Caulobacter segnis]
MLEGIVRLQLDRIRKRIAENHGIVLAYDQAVAALIVSRCTEVASGGRMIDAISDQHHAASNFRSPCWSDRWPAKK